MKPSLIILLLVTLLSACSELSIEPSDNSVGVSYRCDSGSVLKVEYNDSTATLTLDGDTYSLSGERSASGSKYTNGEMTFWGKGDEAMLMIGNETWQCHRSH
ncbi:hypothetical protein CWC05_18065 [Pseudoalteromonas ruthenica]|uniref:C-type lysozyme inhibitor domain-containing protein n=1 Tax=Pseudoalteromonas ruthenica TaxID=151081 RepID=A0A5S3YZT7_9GAMM|nr:MliC family protein [Pseudoalteromonas ruthenica]TMP85539.1 hypothetical protein CWC05_18065 [Pseudoalteromonas ruthenica]